MTDDRNVYPRLCWGCLGVIEDETNDQSLMTYGGYCMDCLNNHRPEMRGLYNALLGFPERMNDVSEREELLRKVDVLLNGIDDEGETVAEKLSVNEGQGIAESTHRYKSLGDPANTVDPPTTTVQFTADVADGAVPWGVYNPPFNGSAFGPAIHMGNLAWGPIMQNGPSIQYVPPLTEQRIREIFIEMLASPEFREAIGKVLEDDARAIRENPAFQPTTPRKQAGTCCACLAAGDDLVWVGNRLAHRDEVCRRKAAEMEPVREHRG